MTFEDWKLLPDRDVFVTYAWEWLCRYSSDCSEQEESSPESVYSPSSSLPSEDELDFDTGCTTHTVTFKCMGTTKDSDIQETLRYVASAIKEGKDTPVRLKPEPENPVDANAISFECRIQEDWKKIGYVVQETLTVVHDAITRQDILSIKIAWVKFLLCWSRSGPGLKKIKNKGPV